MKIYTSYFNSKAPKERKVCIAKSARFFSGPRVSELAPSNPWGGGDWRACYRAELEKLFGDSGMLDLGKFLKAIHEKTANPILCCHEKNVEECHRSVLAAYIEERTGIKVEEWTNESE